MIDRAVGPTSPEEIERDLSEGTEPSSRPSEEPTPPPRRKVRTRRPPPPVQPPPPPLTVELWPRPFGTEELAAPVNEDAPPAAPATPGLSSETAEQTATYVRLNAAQWTAMGRPVRFQGIIHPPVGPAENMVPFRAWFNLRGPLAENGGPAIGDRLPGMGMQLDRRVSQGTPW
jgi:hypothetical protein